VRLLIGAGTCENAYAEQSSCQWNETSNLVISGYSLDILGCPQIGNTLTGDDSSEFYLDVSPRCRGFFTAGESETVYGMDVYVAISSRAGENAGLCDEEKVSQLTPLLTSEDWNEPQPGRRSMCGQVSWGNQDYYVFMVNLGNEPCSGTPPTDAPSSSSSAAPVKGVSSSRIVALISVMMAVAMIAAL
jgi:hypothetical protein